MKTQLLKKSAKKIAEQLKYYEPSERMYDKYIKEYKLTTEEIAKLMAYTIAEVMKSAE